MITAKAREFSATEAFAKGQEAVQRPRALGEEAFNPQWHQLALRVQPKLAISSPDDSFERDADSVADQVMRMPDWLPGEEMLPTRFLHKSAALPESSSNSFDSGEEVEARLSQSKGQGSPLPDHIRSYMEPRFGVNFSQVRVHTDSNAIQMNRGIGAQAFTQGSDIYYGAGSNPANMELTAHELTHVVQQGAGSSLLRKGINASGLIIQRDVNSDEFQRGYEDALMGGEPFPGPLIDDALTDYNEGYSRGRHEFGTKSSTSAVKEGQPKQPTDSNAAKVISLDNSYQSALKNSNWEAAAEFLNAFNADDILARLARLTEDDLLKLEHGGWRNPRVGGKAQVVEIIHGIVSSIDPGVYSPSTVFPNNFGDKLGPVGGAVVAAAGGYLAVRLAMPLIAGFWRQIQITLGMAKIASEANKEEVELAEQEIGAVIERLMNTGGQQRVLVTYQSMTPALDRELYLTTQEGAQYAEAVSQGRNLYMVRIPERLFQILVERQLIEVRQGSMGDQVGDDIRIAAGAMEFLSKYFSKVPLTK